MSFYDPWGDARALGVRVELTDLDVADSVFVADRNLVLVRRSAGRAERRCGVSHQLAHIAHPQCSEHDTEVASALQLVPMPALVAAALDRSTVDGVADSLGITVPVLMARTVDMPNFRTRFVWPDIIKPHRCMRVNLEHLLRPDVAVTNPVIDRKRKIRPHAATA